MEERNRLTPTELDTMLSFYQSIITLITFFAGFVFVTIPLVTFSIQISSIYSKLVIYWLLAALLIYTVLIDLYHMAFSRLRSRTMPQISRIVAKHYDISRIITQADRLFGIAMFFALSSISFMLLLKGQEYTIEALTWFLISIIRPTVGHYLQHRPPKQTTEK